MTGKVVNTLSLLMDVGNTDIVVAQTSSGAEELAKRIPEARDVASQAVAGDVLLGLYEAKRQARRPSLVLCGNGTAAEEGAAGLVMSDQARQRVREGNPTGPIPTLLRLNFVRLREEYRPRKPRG